MKQADLGIDASDDLAKLRALVLLGAAHNDGLSGATMPRASSPGCAMTCIDEIAFVRQ